MVLTLKRWKSRTPPGIAAGVMRGKTHSQVKGLSHGTALLASLVRRNGAAGWSSPVARQAHNLKVVGSNPTPATTVEMNTAQPTGSGRFSFVRDRPIIAA